MNKFKQKALVQYKYIRRTNRLLIGNNRNRNLFLAAFVLSMVVTQAWVIDAWSFGQLTNKLSNKPSVFTNTSLFMAIIVLVVIDIVPRAMRYWLKKLETDFRYQVLNESQQLYWNAYATYDLQDQENPTMQDALNNASRNQDSVKEIFFIQWNLCISTLTVLVSAIALASIAWWYFLVIVIMILPKVFWTRKRKLKSYVQEKRLNEVQRYKSSLEWYISTKESILNNSRQHFLSLFSSIRRKMNGLHEKNDRYYNTVSFWGDIWYYLFMGVILFSVSSKVISGDVMIGTMFIVFGAINRMYNELENASVKLIDLEVAVKKAEDFFLVLDSTPAIVDAVGAVSIDDSQPPTIEFDNVHFKYPGSEQWILKGVSFRIEKGETIGLIAKNGEGKTTIGLLLLRFYDPNEGSIRINGIDLRLVKRTSLFSIAGALFQDFSIIKFTIRSAIMSAKPGVECSDFQIWSILEKVGLKDYVKSLPHQLDHKVSRIFKDSIKLSGGQNQKLGLATLLYRDPKLVILDEFTSALDPEAEKEIIDQYGKIIEGKTGLIISHRYLSLKIVDKIIVLHDGKIAESGIQRDLLAIHDGLFKKLYLASELQVHVN